MSETAAVDDLNDGITRRLVKTETDPLGFEIRHEEWSMAEGGGLVPVVNAYTPDGDWIGEVERARWLYDRGIAPQKSEGEHCVCSIGFSHTEQKWYGWSHRAIAGFGFGDTVAAGDVLAEDGGFEIGYFARTLDDCETMAWAFAKAVS